MYWRHRVMKRIENEETNLYVVEVFSTENGTILGWSEKEDVWGETIEDLRQSLAWMLEATEQPILDEAELLQRAEEIEALGADVHEVGIEALGYEGSEEG